MKFSDIDNIILTHGHIDHYGAARRIIASSDKKIIISAHEQDRFMIEHGFEISRIQMYRFYRLMGVPFVFQLLFQLLHSVFSSLAENCPVDRTLTQGDSIKIGDYDAVVIETPGHTKGSICLFIEDRNMLFSGDHILGHITPNAFVMLEKGPLLPVRSSQVEFFDSLRKVEELSPKTVYPAHGERIDDAGKTIAMYREQFLLRQKNILSILSTGEFTVYQTARKLFPDIRGKRLPLEVFLAISEVYSHLQVLQKDNAVKLSKKQNTLYYSV